MPYFDQLPPYKLACSVTDFFRLHRPHVMYTVPVGQNPTGAVSHNCLDGQIVLFLRCRTYYLSTGRHKIPPSISLRHSDLRASLFFLPCRSLACCGAFTRLLDYGCEAKEGDLRHLRGVWYACSVSLHFIRQVCSCSTQAI